MTLQKGKVITVKMAKATHDDIDRVRRFFQMVEEVVRFGTHTPLIDGESEVVDADRFYELVESHWGHRGPGVGAGSWSRVVDGLQILLINCCDPDAEVLEWKPEILAAMKAAGLDEVKT